MIPLTDSQAWWGGCVPHGDESGPAPGEPSTLADVRHMETSFPRDTVCPSLPHTQAALIQRSHVPVTCWGSQSKGDFSVTGPEGPCHGEALGTWAHSWEWLGGCEAQSPGAILRAQSKQGARGRQSRVSGGQAAESRERGAATRNPSTGRGLCFCTGLRSGQLSGQMDFRMNAPPLITARDAPSRSLNTPSCSGGEPSCISGDTVGSLGDGSRRRPPCVAFLGGGGWALWLGGRVPASPWL